MPITKSAKKALRQNIKRRERNLIYKKQIKTLLKKARGLVLAKKAVGAGRDLPLLAQIYKILDKAAKKGVIKKGTAARKKSRLARLIFCSAKN